MYVDWLYIWTQALYYASYLSIWFAKMIKLRHGVINADNFNNSITMHINLLKPLPLTVSLWIWFQNLGVI